MTATRYTDELTADEWTMVDAATEAAWKVLKARRPTAPGDDRFFDVENAIARYIVRIRA